MGAVPAKNDPQVVAEDMSKQVQDRARSDTALRIKTIGGRKSEGLHSEFGNQRPLNSGAQAAAKSQQHRQGRSIARLRVKRRAHDPPANRGPSWYLARPERPVHITTIRAVFE